MSVLVKMSVIAVVSMQLLTCQLCHWDFGKRSDFTLMNSSRTLDHSPCQRLLGIVLEYTRLDLGLCCSSLFCDCLHPNIHRLHQKLFIHCTDT